MTTTADDATAWIAPFGIDATTGAYFGEHTTATAIARALDPRDAQAAEMETVKARIDASTPRWGVLPGVDADDLGQAGWGFVLPASTIGPPLEDIKAALRPLLELRKQQAGDRYFEFTEAKGFRATETAGRFLARHGAGPGSANRLPYYVLLVGGPEEIPFSFQYALDVQYAVGRLPCGSLDEYARYASAVVAAEKRSDAPKRVTYFAPKTDPATVQSAEQLVVPVAERACAEAGAGWNCTRLIGLKATKANFLKALEDGQTKLLFSASHGLVFPSSDPRQVARQGSLLCQDWPGRPEGPVPQDCYVCADDLGTTTDVAGLIAMIFACYGGGTPRDDYFPERSKVAKRQLADADFIAALPQKLLTHQNGSALAVVAHVERTWTASFMWPYAGVQNAAFAHAMTMLMQRHRLGYAMEEFGQRLADLGSRLSDIYDLLRADTSLVAEPVEFSTLWTARNDTRSFITLGDPAVRIP
jgi:hypothetical protein